MEYDIVIIGGGPAGLSFASSMADLAVKVLVVEKASIDTIKNPKDDGREIALTHLSNKILKKLGVWQLIDKEKISPLKSAKVFDGNAGTPSLLSFKADKSTNDVLGYLVPNCLIRKALFENVVKIKNIDIKTSAMVEDVKQGELFSTAILADGTNIKTKLVVAADSRFSAIRRKMGIPALMKDFSKVMIVTKMMHEKPHNNVALENFDYGQTVALLPMIGNNSSVILTLKTDKVQKVLDMSNDDFNEKITSFFKDEFGKMTQVGERISYPLIATHAQTFISDRFALIGDAAVGMHPVTAHGFNLGLRGQDILADLVSQALVNNQDIGSKQLLEKYEKKSINFSRLMFFGTNGIVALFTTDTPVIKQVRKLVLKFAQNFPPIKYLITQQLTEKKHNLFPF